MSCSSTKVNFIPISDDSFPAKPDNYEILVIYEDSRKLERDYTVVGEIVIEKKASGISAWGADKKLVELLKKEARKFGADAIIDIGIGIQITSSEWQTSTECGSGPVAEWLACVCGPADQICNQILNRQENIRVTCKAIAFKSGDG